MIEHQHSAAGPLRASTLTTLTRQHLRNHIQQSLSATTDDQHVIIPALVDSLIQTITGALATKNSVRLRRIGCLVVFDKQARQGGRIFQSGEMHVIPERTTITLRLRKNEGTAEIGTTELAAQLKSRHPDAKNTTIRAVIKCFSQEIQRISTGAVRLELRGLGVFYPSYRPAKMVRDPRTGERIQQDAFFAIRFRAAKRLLQAINTTNMFN